MRKLAFILTAMIGMGLSANAQQNNSGVTINGVTWATRNVDKPGTFAAKPESPGMFYQWGSKVGWSATDPMVNSNGGKNWVDFDSPDEKWIASNDPCPAGWHVPAEYELAGLIDSGNSWTYNYNNTGVAGRFFGSAPNRIFIPAAGVRNYSNDKSGKFGYSNTDAGIWGANYEILLRVDDEKVPMGVVSRHTGANVRCVKREKNGAMSATTDKGVTIGGITWATRNVDKPSTFAGAPDSKGMLYQWNRRVGWSAVDPIINSNGGRTWDKSIPQGAVWLAANDPCPTGWRVPTASELEKLKDSPNRWLVNGRLFGFYPNQIYLPSVRHRSGFDNGKLEFLFKEDAMYASATRTKYEEIEGRVFVYYVYLLIWADGARVNDIYWDDAAISVRCVRK